MKGEWRVFKQTDGTYTVIRVMRGGSDVIIELAGRSEKCEEHYDPATFPTYEDARRFVSELNTKKLDWKGMTELFKSRKESSPPQTRCTDDEMSQG